MTNDFSYEELSVLHDAINIQIREYERASQKYLNPRPGWHHDPSYYQDVHLPTRQKFYDLKDKIIELRRLQKKSK